MPNWHATIDCCFLRNDDLTVREKAEQLGTVLNRFIERQERLGDRQQVDPIGLEVWAMDMANLGEQDEVNPDEFDEVMSEIYDWADFERVWIKTL